MERKGEPPGAPDDYRETVYEIDPCRTSYKVVYSLVQQRKDDAVIDEGKLGTSEDNAEDGDAAMLAQ